MEITWEGLRQMEPGTILHDVFEDGLRFIIVRGPASLCAYIGLPKEHPLAGHSYDDLPVTAHGGLTFARLGDDKPWPKGYYWYGWDFAHSGDYCFSNDEAYIQALGHDHSKEKKWLVEDVIKESWETLYDFKHLMSMAERIASRAKRGASDV